MCSGKAISNFALSFTSAHLEVAFALLTYHRLKAYLRWSFNLAVEVSQVVKN